MHQVKIGACTRYNSRWCVERGSEGQIKVKNGFVPGIMECIKYYTSFCQHWKKVCVVWSMETQHEMRLVLIGQQSAWWLPVGWDQKILQNTGIISNGTKGRLTHAWLLLAMIGATRRGGKEGKTRGTAKGIGTKACWEPGLWSSGEELPAQCPLLQGANTRGSWEMFIFNDNPSFGTFSTFNSAPVERRNTRTQAHRQKKLLLLSLFGETLLGLLLRS